MKRKILKIILLTISMVALLVAMLVPCFAYQIDDIDWDYFLYENCLPTDMDCPALYSLPAMLHKQDSIFLSSGYVMTGEHIISIIDNTDYLIGDRFLFQCASAVDVCVDFMASSSVTSTIEDAEFNFSYYMDEDGVGQLSISAINNEYDEQIMFVYSIALISENRVQIQRLDMLYVDGVPYMGNTISNISFAFELCNDGFGSMLFDAMQVLYGGDTNDNFICPREFYYGYLAGLEWFKEYEASDDFTWGYNIGFDEGKDLGLTQGFETGYESGYEEGYNAGTNGAISETMAYEIGYKDALKDIESGDFGRNFLGTMFSAPFEILNSFKLVEWATADGLVISFSLATLFSAVVGLIILIAVLKMMR